MKYRLTLLILLCGTLLTQCIIHKKVVAYAIPPDYPEEKRKQLTEILDKGQDIYKANCAECHGIFTKGKDNIPNFSTTQLDSYTSRFMRRNPKNHAVLKNMSQDQLNEVFAFLRFKKTSKPDSVLTKKKSG